MSDYLFGTIANPYVNGSLKLILDGEDTPTTKTYTFLNDYSPLADDRVLILSVNGTYVVMGKITNISAQSGHKIVTSLRIRGSVGFFDTSPQTKTTVQAPLNLTMPTTSPASYSSSWGGQVRTDMNNLRTTVNNMRTALNNYGLI